MNETITISDRGHFVPMALLTDEEVSYVSGGNPMLVAAAAAAAAFGALNAAEAFGEKIGKAIYSATH
ncbi:hypothetical protein NX773_01200 [Massilia solisilvae]|uniref:Class IIb bacteriocin, lactobin A/cerein 7B family n=1 Tax=Massilia solisilvae TaxID=1811225 RepID=A0ABT2BFB9_9BURK|nr:hypothetical protein [Massilia solisilvae]MCS0606780.1 hypothetical protein [Massilia solisilvae]